MSCIPATFVVGRGRAVRTGVAATVGGGVGEGLGDGVSGATVGVAVATGVGEGLGRASGGRSRALRARPAPTTRTAAIATPLASFIRNGT